MLAKVKKYAWAEVYEAHGPSPSLVIKEQLLAQEFWLRKEDRGKGSKEADLPRNAEDLPASNATNTFKTNRTTYC